ncbi:hypothetical protein HY792_01885 [Candidatus Desantisbacteria bacterium]|nr:hypothetical protein [Candidatus Desantisbacteria bacterium]
MNIFSNNGKRKAISQTLLDCGKILLAALVATDFIKFAIVIKLAIVLIMITVLIIGILIHPDEYKGE